MPEEKQKSRRITTVSILAVAALLLLGGLYLANVSSKLSYQRQRNFRIAATLAKTTEAKVENVAKILESETYDLAAASKGDGGDTGDDHEHSGGSQAGLPCFHHVHVHAPEIQDPEQGYATIEAPTGRLGFRRKQDQEEETEVILHLEADIACFFRDLRRPAVFDDVLILGTGGRVLFQAGDSGARIRELSVDPRGEDGATAEGTTADPTAWLVGLSRLQEVELAGERYALFRQPLRLELRREGSEEPPKWEVVGLVRSNRLLSEALRLDPAHLAVLVAAFLLVLCAWPLFKLWAAGSRERLHPREVRRVSLSLVVGSALLGMFALDLGLHRGVRHELEGDLEDSAMQIETALESEIGDALLQLESLNELRCRPRPEIRGLRAAASPDGGDPRRFRIADELWEGGDPYPHLEMVFWTDREGMQIEKWTVAEPTPIISVQEREYFRRAYRRELWSPDRWAVDKPPSRGFFVEPIRSWTTGKQQVVVSVSHDGGVPESCDAAAAAAMTITRLPSMLRPILPPHRGFAVVDSEGRVVFHSQPERNGVESFLEECEDPPELQGALFSRTSRHFVTRYRGNEHVMFTQPLAGLPWHLVVFEEKALHETANLEAMEVALVLTLFQILLVVLALLLIHATGGRGTLRSLWPSPGDLASYSRMSAVWLLMALGFLVSLWLVRSPRSLVAAGLLFPLAAVGWTVGAAALHGHRAVRRRRAGLGLGLAASGVLLVLEARGAPAEGDGGTGLAVFLTHLSVLATAGLVAWVGPRLSRTWLLKAWRLARISHVSPTALFVATGFLLLTVLSALPATTFLQAGYRERLVLETRRGQMRLAQDLIRRHREIRNEYGVPEDSPLARGAVDDDRDIHYRGYFDTRVELERTGELGNPAPRNLLTLWPFSALHFVNTHSIRARGAVAADGGEAGEDNAGSRSWSRTVDGNRLVLAGAPPTGEPGVTISSETPGLPPTDAGTSLLAAALFVAGIAVALVFVGRRVFHVDFRLRTPLSLSELEEMYYARLLVVVAPGTEIREAFGSAKLSVNLARTGTVGGDRDLEDLAEKLPEDGLVRVDHLEGALDDAPSRAKALPLFEAAVARATEDARIVVFSHRDPRAVLEAAEAEIETGSDSDTQERRLIQRWREILDRFAEEWVPDPGDPGAFEREVAETGLTREQQTTLIQECRWDRSLQATGCELLRRSTLRSLRPDEMVRRIAQEADDHYRALWQALDAEERHLLAQLASGCLVNRGLRRLLDRLLTWNLVVRDLSVFRVMSEGFRRFVLSHHDPEALHRWEEEAAVGFWQRIRAPFFTALGLIALFLLVTQRELFNVTLALGSAAAASVPAGLKLFEWIRRARGQG